MERLVKLVFLLQIATAMLIPEDTEMLDGYGHVSFPESSFDDDYFEARSLSLGPLFNSVRNKRALNYDVKESDGLISHFRPNTVNGYDKLIANDENEFKHRTERSFRKFKKWLSKFQQSDDDTDNSFISSFPRRNRRNVETEKKSKITSPKDDKSTVYSERLPTAMKLSKASDRDSPSAAALVGKFPRSPFEYSKIHHEEDSMAMDTSSLSVNEGIKSRTPRVNFVTQQKKSLDHDDTKASSTKSDFYKTPPLLHNSKESTAASENERYPERSSTTKPSSYPDYKNRDANNNHYDDRFIEDMYPPPPPQPPVDMYDPIPMDYNAPYADYYMRRFPYSGYSGHYPGSRYDIPDYRDYPPMYGNDIDNRYYMRTDMMPPPSSTLPRKRTIYYAYLPEVVRSPPTMGYRYRSYDRQDSYYPDYYNYDANMVSNAYRRPVEKPFKHDYRTSRPMKNDDRDDMLRNSSSFKEKRFNHERSYDDNKLSMHTYLQRRPSEYDSFYY